jgi:hypothetical protein
MRILVISESINVEDSSASKVNVALITNLHKAGFFLRVLHYSHKQIDLENIETILIKENRFSVLFFLSRLVGLIQTKTNIIVNHRLEQIFGFSFTHSNDTKSIVKEIRKQSSFNPDLILTLSKGGSFRPHRAMLKLSELQSKWIAYIHDPYPFHIYPRPYNWVEKSYKHKEKFMRLITEKSKYLAFPSLLLKEWMQSYFPAVEGKSLIIPHQIGNGVATHNLPDFFKPNEFSLLHAGNLLKQRTPEFLINGFLKFLENNPHAKNDAKLYLLGYNDYHTKILAPFLNHKNIIIKSKLAYDIVQNMEKSVTANIILESISEISPFLPGKFPNCVVANKPIIALGPYYSETRRLLGDDYPYWSEANDELSIEKSISSLYEKWQNNPKALTLNRNDLIDYCSEVNLKNELENLKTV